MGGTWKKGMALSLKDLDVPKINNQTMSTVQHRRLSRRHWWTKVFYAMRA